MISARMSRPARVLFTLAASAATVAAISACGPENIRVSKSDPTYKGAILFSQRCSGCHTLSYAATRGSASNVRTREITNGPNFNVRCERPITRVLYAIENGGFSGAIMPQNVVVGQQAIDVARFVATYAGRQGATQQGGKACPQQPIGAIPPTTGTTTARSSARGGKQHKKGKPKRP